MIEPVFQSSIPQDDMRHQDSLPRRRPRKKPCDKHEETEDSFTHCENSEAESEENG